MKNEYFIVSVNTNHILKTSESLRGAKISYSAYLKKGYTSETLKIIPADEYVDPVVEVMNLMSGKPVKIYMSQVGGPCDPSTERHWTM